MKTVNLTGESDISYKIQKFPDGQVDIILQADTSDLEGEEIKIMSRFNSFEDLGLIICTTKALRNLGVKNIHLYIPYLLGARSERRFNEGSASYLVEIIAPIINAQEYKSVIVIDVHHPSVTHAVIKNLKLLSNAYITTEFLADYYLTHRPGDFVLVSPDKGAYEKIRSLARVISYTDPILVCDKARDLNGKIIETIVPFNTNNVGKDFVIVDDICDGGRTFIEIAKVLKGQIARHASKRDNKIFLVVTHGVFSAGFDELSKYFDGIYCTNSVKEVENKLVKQLNVF